MSNKAIGESSFISLMELAGKQSNCKYIPLTIVKYCPLQNIREGREGERRDVNVVYGSMCVREKRGKVREM